MTKANDIHPRSLLNEIAIADLNHFQIAVPTVSKIVESPILSTWIPVPKRFYQAQGWFICKRQIMACFSGLTISKVFSKNSPFQPIQRLAASVPISFEVKSNQRLPAEVLSQATFVCQLPNTDFSHHVIFHRQTPRFVRIYPFVSGSSLLESVDQMLADKDSFISQNYTRLKQIPFYQDSFGL